MKKDRETKIVAGALLIMFFSLNGSVCAEEPEKLKLKLVKESSGEDSLFGLIPNELGEFGQITGIAADSKNRIIAADKPQ